MARYHQTVGKGIPRQFEKVCKRGVVRLEWTQHAIEEALKDGITNRPMRFNTSSDKVQLVEVETTSFGARERVLKALFRTRADEKYDFASC